MVYIIYIFVFIKFEKECIKVYVFDLKIVDEIYCI